jgi:hypothetical protein
VEGILNRRFVLADRPNARRGEKLRVNGVLEIAEQSAQALLSYLGSRDLDQFLHTAEMNPNHSCVGGYARHHARNWILRLRALRAPATKTFNHLRDLVTSVSPRYSPNGTDCNLLYGRSGRICGQFLRVWAENQSHNLTK